MNHSNTIQEKGQQSSPIEHLYSTEEVYGHAVKDPAINIDEYQLTLELSRRTYAIADIIADFCEPCNKMQLEPNTTGELMYQIKTNMAMIETTLERWLNADMK